MIYIFFSKRWEFFIFSQGAKVLPDYYITIILILLIFGDNLYEIEIGF